MATNYTNITIRTLTNSKIIVPFSASGTGTVSTQSTGVVGVGTKFLTELVNGAWIVDLSANEFREVMDVLSDTEALIAQPFTVDLSSISLVIIKKPRPCEIAVMIPIGNASGTIITTESSILPVGLPINISKANRDESSARDLIAPCIIDATGTVAIISILY